MNRKEFIQSCSMACAGALGLGALLQACTPIRYVQAQRTDNKLVVSRKEFIKSEKNSMQNKRYVVVKSSWINYPIVLYRFSDSEFSAVELKCSHQGAELNVNGDLLSCPAHGSEFTNKGEIVQGPAGEKLRTYQITTDSDNIYIALK